jgi:hypothetical protein
VRGALAVIASMALASGAPEPHGGEPARPALDDLAFLAGCWSGTTPAGHRLDEHYLAPRAGMLLGTVRESAGQRVVFHEFIRIRATADGVRYEPHPNGKPANVSFLLEATRAGYARFANRAHDFPQVIEYAREGDRLTTIVSGMRNGAQSVETYATQQTGCSD